MDNLFFKPHELAAMDRKERTGYYLTNRQSIPPQAGKNQPSTIQRVGM
jgi:hypothetical protein